MNPKAPPLPVNKLGQTYRRPKLTDKQIELLGAIRDGAEFKTVHKNFGRGLVQVRELNGEMINQRLQGLRKRKLVRWVNKVGYRLTPSGEAALHLIGG